MTRDLITVGEWRHVDLPFLYELSHTPEVMRYAREFPGLRGWPKSDSLETAWHTYQAREARAVRTRPCRPGE